MKKLIYILLAVLVLPASLCAQKKTEKQLVQISGFALASDSLTGIPFVHIGIKGTSRYGTARGDGFFSFAVAEGDTLIFTSIGFSPSKYIVPTGNEDNKLSIIQPMNKQIYVYKDIPIYFWGDRGNFPYAFVHTKIPKTLQEVGEANTNRQLLAAIGQYLPVDGNEAAQRSIQYNAAQYYYYGQQAPQNIFNPLAWAEFIKALKNGDFKQKPTPTAPVQQDDY